MAGKFYAPGYSFWTRPFGDRNDSDLSSYEGYLVNNQTQEIAASASVSVYGHGSEYVGGFSITARAMHKDAIRMREEPGVTLSHFMESSADGKDVETYEVRSIPLVPNSVMGR